MIETRPQLVIFEGPQGSGKSTGARHLETLGYTLKRGIPETRDLLRNSSYINWSYTTRLMRTCAETRIPTVFDRSLWSLVAYHIRTRLRNQPERVMRLYDLGVNNFLHSTAGASYLLVFLDAPVATCVTRNMGIQTPATLRSAEEYRAELLIYQTLYDHLEASGVNIQRVNNSSDQAALQKTLNEILITQLSAPAMRVVSF